jgi:hypothetical protein
MGGRSCASTTASSAAPSETSKSKLKAKKAESPTAVDNPKRVKVQPGVEGSVRAVAEMDGRGQRLLLTAEAELVTIKDTMTKAAPTVLYAGGESDTERKAAFDADLKRSTRDFNTALTKIKNIAVKLEASPNKQHFESLLSELENASATVASHVILNKLIVLKTIVPDHFMDEYEKVRKGESFIGGIPKGMFQVTMFRCKVEKAFQHQAYTDISAVCKSSSKDMIALADALRDYGDGEAQAKAAATRMVEELVLTQARGSKPSDDESCTQLEACLLVPETNRAVFSIGLV